MKEKRMLALLVSSALLLAGCSGDPAVTTPVTTTATAAPIGGAMTAEDAFSDRDQTASYDASKAAVITLNGASATCSSNAVRIAGGTVTILDEGTYILSGTLSDGSIVVDAGADDKTQLVLRGVSVTSSQSAALYVREADKVVVTLEGENALTNGGSFTADGDTAIDGALFSKQDLSLNGSGSLSVTSPGGHGIVCKDDLVIADGTYTVNSAAHGIDANDSIRVKTCRLTVEAGKDGLHAENSEDTAKGFVYVAGGTYTLQTAGDGISGSAYVQIDGGTFSIVAGGGSENAEQHTSDGWGTPGGGGHHGGGPGGMPPGARNVETVTDTADSTSLKGIKAGGNLILNHGTFTVDSADDAFHSNASLGVNNGTFTIATGDDAFHADDTLTVSGGTIRVTDSYEGLEGLHVNVTGGDIRLVCTDDGVNAAGGTDSSGMGGARPEADQFRGQGGPGGGGASNGSITIASGSLYIQASGDGIDANGTLTVSGGHTVVVGPTQGDTATLDYDTSAVITGGTFIGTGASGMAQTFSDSAQGVIAVSVGNQAAGTAISIQDGNGNTLISHTPELSFAVLIISSPDLQKGETYTVCVGSQTADFAAS